MDYEILYGKRKSVSLTVKNGKLTVKAPRGTTPEYIARLIEKHKAWINRSLEREKILLKRDDELSRRNPIELKSQAKAYFEIKTAEYAKIMNLKYSRIEISSAKKRFGSCNSKGVIRYSYRLMLYPEAARDYVIVHELAHLVYMNHSKAFYDVIKSYMPDYKERIKMLKK